MKRLLVTIFGAVLFGTACAQGDNPFDVEGDR